MEVTQIKNINKSRFSIIIDEEFAFALSKKKLNELNIQVNDEINCEEYNFILQNYILPEAKDKALNYITYSAKTEKDIRKYLDRRNFNKIVIEKTIDFLRRYKLIDDFNYAVNYINNSISNKPLGIKAIYYNLRIKGISNEIVDQAFLKTEYDEEYSALQLVQKKFNKIKKFDQKTMKKIYNNLLRKGFSYNSVKYAIKSLQT